MTQMKTPAVAPKAEPHDPYKMHTLEQILKLFNGGKFLSQTMDGHKLLMQDLLDHNEEFGPKGCNGSMTITIGYSVGNAGDVGMTAKSNFNGPKAPPSSASAHINNAGELTLYSPMMRQMQQPIRDVTDHDEDGVVRDT